MELKIIDLYTNWCAPCRTLAPILEAVTQELNIELVKIDIEENGASFEENAILKAKAIAAIRNEVVLADDSGLVIDALNGEPGIFSARYMGENTSYHIKNNNLIQRLDEKNEKDRTAHFVCAIAAVFPNGEVAVTRGSMDGVIAHEEAGENGFGYDPIFYLPEYNCTAAQLSADQKNRISHRGKALIEMKKVLVEKLI